MIWWTSHCSCFWALCIANRLNRGVLEATVSKAEHEVLRSKYDELRGKYEALQHELAELKRLIFGARSEKQRDVGFGGSAAADPSAGNPQTITYQRRKQKAHPGRTPLPHHLPVEEVVIEPDEDTTGLELDNNLIENSIRPLALGRKNYLFAGSHKDAQRAAMMYSFFASCQKLDINPWQWLCDVLQRIPDHPVNQLRELLPDQWKPVGTDT